MTDFAALLHPDRGQAARSIVRVTKDGLDQWLHAQPARARSAIAAARFDGAPNTHVILPGDDPDAWTVAIGGDDASAADPWILAAIATALPPGTYRPADPLPDLAELGWLLAQHRFDRYRAAPEPSSGRILLTPRPARVADIVRLAEATALVRDLVDTPAGDMGPEQLSEAVEAVGREFGAQTGIVSGDALAQQYPMIEAVGRAASRARAPRLIELDWGDPAHPLLAIVGKGVCFDTGGLDIKPSSGMLLMKKDMGGAAHALALARLVMAAQLPVRLHMLIPAVENAISADAFRPGDILTSRKGLHVEIGNTDAEGRLILADALTRACERAPALLIDFATLTGAARVALGPDLPALFANDDRLAADFAEAGVAVADPVWRLPLWAPYHDMLKSDLADINNAGTGGFAGSITAALFLERFVTPGIAWAHLDTFAWRPAAKPGRPKGGDALGLRAAWDVVRRRFER